MSTFRESIVGEVNTSDGGKKIVVDLVPRDFNLSTTGFYFNESKRFRHMYKVWMPGNSIEENVKSFFTANFPNFSEYLKEKYGKIDVKLSVITNLIKDFPISISEYESRDIPTIELSLINNGKEFGRSKIYNLPVKDEKIDYEKTCSVYKVFRYTPSIEPEISDSDFYNIMKHNIMGLTYRTNEKKKIDKKLILNDEEFYAALDLEVNRDKHSNEHWNAGREGIASKHNEKRADHLFLWSFWAGWGHGTTMKVYSCHNCIDDKCEPVDSTFYNFKTENVKDGFRTYEPLGIKIPFP